MDKKTSSIVAIVVATLLCGLPGFLGVCMSGMAIIGALLPDSGIPQDEVILLTASSLTITGLGLICMVIPVGIGFWAWWSYKKEARAIEAVLLPEEDF